MPMHYYANWQLMQSWVTNSGGVRWWCNNFIGSVDISVMMVVSFGINPMNGWRCKNFMGCVDSYWSVVEVGDVTNYKGVLIAVPWCSRALLFLFNGASW